jgi:hypothetical protein
VSLAGASSAGSPRLGQARTVQTGGANAGALDHPQQRLRGATHDLLAGQTAAQAIHQHGICDPEHAGTLGDIEVLLSSGNPGFRALLERASRQQRGASFALGYVAAHGPALQAVRNGEPASGVFKRMGISDPELTQPLKNIAAFVASANQKYRRIGLLSRIDLSKPQTAQTLEKLTARGPAKDAVRAGQSVHSVTERMGISDPHHIQQLEKASARGPALAQVQAGEQPRRVAVRLGISDDAHIQALINVSVLINSGDPALHAEALRADLGDKNQMAQIQRKVAQGPALARVLDGEDAAVVRSEMGISDPQLGNQLKNVAALMASGDPAWQAAAAAAELGESAQSAALETLAARGPALAAVKSGEPVATVCERIGIAHPMLVNDLKNVAALAGCGDARLRAQALQLSLDPQDPVGRMNQDRLEGLAFRGPAAAAVALGQPAADVIERMGIAQPQHVKYLKSMAALMAFSRKPANHALRKDIDQAVVRSDRRDNVAAGAKALEVLAAKTAGLAAIKEGKDLEVVAREMGIEEPASIKLLKNVAALVSSPEPTESGFAKRIDAAALEDPVVAELIERRTAAGPAVSAVEAGESVPSVMRRMGIANPDNVKRLEDLARTVPSQAANAAPAFSVF